MASALESFVTCDICFEVYVEPQILQCHHTFCVKCVNKIKQETTIQCPICKATSNVTDVKSDFKTVALLETYLGDEKKQSEKINDKTGSKDAVKMCDVCSKEGEGHTVVCKCKDCDYLLCKGCEESHRIDDVTKDHVVLSLVKVVTETKLYLRKGLEQLQEHKDKLSTDQDQLKDLVRNLDLTEQNALEEINQQENEIIAEVKAHHNQLREKVHKTITEHKQSLKECEINVRSKFKEAQSKVVFVEDFLEQKTDVLIAELGDNICQEIMTCLSTSKSKIPEQFSRLAKFTIHVVKGTGYQRDQSTSVKIAGMDIIIQDYQKDGFASITDIEFKHKKDVLIGDNDNLKCKPNLSIKGDKILCLLSNEAFFYDKELKLTKKIHYSGMKNIIAVVETKTGPYIVACSEKGLNIHDNTGTHLQTVSSDVYSDLCLKNKEIYAYNGKNNTLCIFQQTPHSWAKVKEVQFSHESCNDNVHMTQNEIYISTKADKCVYKYNYNGVLLRSYGKSDDADLPGDVVPLEDPWVCSADDYGNFLVVNGPHNNRKCTVFTESGQSSELLKLISYTCETVLIHMESKIVFIVMSKEDRRKTDHFVNGFYKPIRWVTFKKYHIHKYEPKLLPDIL